MQCWSVCAPGESQASPPELHGSRATSGERERKREGGLDGGEGEGGDSGKQEAVVRGRDRRRRRGAGKNVESQTWASGFVAMLCWISGVSNP